MTSIKFKTLAAQLTPEQINKIREEANRRHLTMSAVMRLMVDQYFSTDWLDFMKIKLDK